MKQILIERSEFERREEMYVVFQKKLNLPEWFGKNPYAVWDMISGHIEMPCKIILKGFPQIETNSSDARHIRDIITVFMHAKEELPDEFFFEMIE